MVGIDKIVEKINKKYDKIKKILVEKSFKIGIC